LIFLWRNPPTISTNPCVARVSGSSWFDAPKPVRHFFEKVAGCLFRTKDLRGFLLRFGKKASPPLRHLAGATPANAFAAATSDKKWTALDRYPVVIVSSPILTRVAGRAITLPAHELL
jgi:hypothetical protein